MDQQDKRALYEQLKAEFERDPDLRPYESPVRVTVGMLARDAWQYIPFTLPRLLAQGCRMDVVTYVDDASADPTEDILASERLKLALERNEADTIRSYRYLGKLPHRPIEQILAWAKTNMVRESATEYFFALDADVLIPRRAIKDCIAEMDEDPQIGAVCVPYDLKTDHQEQGAMLIRVEVAKQIKFWHEPRCVCVNVAKKLKELRLEMREWKRTGPGGTIEAEHLKFTKECPPPREDGDGWPSGETLRSERAGT